MRDCRERHQADGGQCRVAGDHPVISIGEDQQYENGAPANEQQLRAECCVGRLHVRAPQQYRRHKIVADHDGERHAGDDHHRGCCRQAPDKGRDRHQIGICGHRKQQDEHVWIEVGFPEQQHARGRDRDDEQIDHDEIERKQPRGRAGFFFRVVLNHCDMELARQQERTDKAEEDHGQPRPASRGAREPFRHLRVFRHGAHQLAGAIIHRIDHEQADGEKGQQLDEGFGRDRQHQPVLVLRCIDVACSKQDREHRQHKRHEQRDVAEDRYRGARPVDAQVGDHRRQGFRDRLELQRDVGDRADHCDQGHYGGDALALAVARRDEVGHRGDVVCFCKPDDAAQQQVACSDHECRTDVDRQEVPALPACKANAAEECPGCAIDAERQRIDQRAAALPGAILRHAVAIARHGKKEAEINDRDDDDDPALHVNSV